MTLRDLFNRLRPGLPSLGSSPALWLIDPDPAGKDPDEHALAFLVYEGDEKAHFLANRMSEPTEISEEALVEQVEKKQMELGSRQVPVRSCRLLTAEEIEDVNPRWKRHVYRLPENVTDVALPPKQLTEADVDELGERF